jgi:hypothetical protein
MHATSNVLQPTVQAKAWGAWWLPPNVNACAGYYIRMAAVYPLTPMPRMGVRDHAVYTAPQIMDLLGNPPSDGPAEVAYVAMLGRGSRPLFAGFVAHLQQLKLETKLVVGQVDAEVVQLIGAWRKTTARIVNLSSSQATEAAKKLSEGYAKDPARPTDWEPSLRSALAWATLDEYLWSLPVPCRIKMKRKTVGVIM